MALLFVIAKEVAMPQKRTAKEPLARATMRLPQSLWDEVQHRAIDERITLSELVARALAMYLKGGRA